MTKKYKFDYQICLRWLRIEDANNKHENDNINSIEKEKTWKIQTVCRQVDKIMIKLKAVRTTYKMFQ